MLKYDINIRESGSEELLGNKCAQICHAMIQSEQRVVHRNSLNTVEEDNLWATMTRG